MEVVFLAGTVYIHSVVYANDNYS